MVLILIMLLLSAPAFAEDNDFWAPPDWDDDSSDVYINQDGDTAVQIDNTLHYDNGDYTVNQGNMNYNSDGTYTIRLNLGTEDPPE